MRNVPIRCLRLEESARGKGEDDEYVEMLAQLSGRLPPIIVHRNTMRIIEGMHRLRAAEIRGEQSIDVVFFDGDEEDVFITSDRPVVAQGAPLPRADGNSKENRFVIPHPQRSDRAIAAATRPEPGTVGAMCGCSAVPDVASTTRAAFDGRVLPLCMATGHGNICEPVGSEPEAPARHLPPRQSNRSPRMPDGQGRSQRQPDVPKSDSGRADLPDLVRQGAPELLTSVLDDLCDDLFGRLVRRDQRQRARQYLHGLLETPGRKTIRNIAAFIGGPGIDQRLHHFISDSTWDWEPVRAALTQYVTRAAAPEVWVIRPVMIPKAGLHTVGVSRRFCPDRRKAVHAQQAVGVLAVSEQGSFPVGWRLQMPKEWLEDDRRRTRAALPDDLRAETLGECMAQAFLHLPGERDVTDRPVLLDGRALDATQLFRTLRAGKFPMLVRIPHSMPLAIDDGGFAGYRGHAPQVARQVAEAAKFRRRPITFMEPGRPKAHMVATVDVQAPGSDSRKTPLQLLTINPLGESTGEELWLTNLTTMPIASLVSLTRLLPQVDRDLEVIAEQVGIWDFSGRSYPGWHRHVTLASAAHAARVLSGTGHQPSLSRHWGTGTMNRQNCS
ncbi:transposase [Streptomyces griseus]|uniref:IS701 family transposase n=1 Tax=Streptomyces griseus TaxID=1911 RepID=UPI00068F0982|nr:transposase [Streptomyces griseus]